MSARKIVSIIFHGKNYIATGEYLSDGSVFIYKNAKLAPIQKSLISGGRIERLYLENSGLIKNGILTCDHTFTSASSAASAIAGHNRNGLLEFKTTDGQTLGEYLNALNKKEDEKDETPSAADIDDEIIETYEGEITDVPPEEKIKDGVKYFQRNEKAKRIAMMQSGNVCAYPACKHLLFKRRSGKVYLEAHHLIPISVCKEFSSNIDIPENIVCLCPSCHREVHHGEDAEKIITELYEERKEALEKKNIKLSGGLKQLLDYYGIK